MRPAKNLTRSPKATGTSEVRTPGTGGGIAGADQADGPDRQDAAQMTVGMTKLATDLASFNNTSVQDAITALQSGLVGESEPFRRFGVQLSANASRHSPTRDGIAKQGTS